MGKHSKSKQEKLAKQERKALKAAASAAAAASPIGIGFTSGLVPGAQSAAVESAVVESVTVRGPHATLEVVPDPAPVATAPVATAPAPLTPAPLAPAVDYAPLAAEAQRRVMDLAVEKETLTVRLEDAARQRADLEARLADLSATLTQLQAGRTGESTQIAELLAERDRLRAENQSLHDEVLRLPAELEVVTKSRAVRILQAAPILAIRKPLSTLLIIGAMGALANLWQFSPAASTIYLVVGCVVLAVSAIQFLARNDGSRSD